MNYTRPPRYNFNLITLPWYKVIEIIYDISVNRRTLWIEGDSRSAPPLSYLVRQRSCYRLKVNEIKQILKQINLKIK